MRRRVVDDSADIGFVDAHAEGDRGDHDHAVFVEKAMLIVAAHLGREAGVVRQGLVPLPGQPRGRILHLAPRHAIDDPRLPMPRGQELFQLLARIAAGAHSVADVRPVESADEPARIPQREPLGDIRAGAFVGGRGQGHARHTGKILTELVQFEIIVTEIVSPLRHAMRLVDRDQADGTLLEHVERVLLQ